MISPPSTISMIPSTVLERICDLGIAVMRAHKAPQDMSEDEKFAICVMHGVPIETMHDPETGRLKMATREPCDVKVVNGRLQVFTR